MAFCSNCGAELSEGATSCSNCGAVLKVVSEFDHTAEFDAKDISDNKVYALCVYAFDLLGILLGAILAKDSEYLKFHLREAMKFEIVEFIMVLAASLLCWTIIIPVVAAVFCIIVFVLKIIAFVQVCKGEAKDPWMIRSIGALH